MPNNKIEKLIFGGMTALMMVYGMEVYNTAVNHGGLENIDMVIPVHELIYLSVIVFPLEMIIGGPLARKMTFRMIEPANSHPLILKLTISIMTVCCMCPLMSFVATILLKGVDSEIPAKWIQTTAVNFPMALCWQLFIAEPFVRFLFNKFFINQPLQRSHIQVFKK